MPIVRSQGVARPSSARRSGICDWMRSVTTSARLGGLLGEQQAELVAAEAADDVVGAGGVVQQPGDALEQLVAGEVTLGVVDAP